VSLRGRARIRCTLGLSRSTDRRQKIKKDIHPQISQIDADEPEGSLIFSFFAHLRSSATSADTLSFSLLFLAQPLR
jgi:hypothetical protein